MLEIDISIKYNIDSHRLGVTSNYYHHREDDIKV